MAENKTKQTEESVSEFVNRLDNEAQRKDSITLIGLMQELTGEPAKMWGPSIIGFGTYRYKYESGREGDTCKIGFSPRKGKLSVYATCDIKQYTGLLERLGKHKTGVGCLYINKLDDVDPAVLKELLTVALENET